MTRRRRLVAAVALAPLVALATACGSDGPPPFDVTTVRPLVADALLPGAAHLVTGVDCTPEPGRLGPVACTAVVAGAEVPVLVHPPGPDGRIRVESPAEVVAAADVAARVAERLTADTGVDAEVSCVPDARVSRPGQAFDCVATDPDGREIPLVAMLVDEAGSFQIDWRPADGS